MRICLLLSIVFMLAGCASKKVNSSRLTAPTGIQSGDTRTTTVELLDANTYWLTDNAPDSTYGYQQANPVKVGKRGGSGPVNERRFLNALMGANGEAIGYFRSGSCCPFDTPNGLMGGRGLLDIYRVFLQGGKDTVTLFINMYDEGDLLIPKGFTAKK